MIKRESYMNQIRPFIGTELVKVLTEMRRSGKSVMLDLVKEELRSQGISDSQIISIHREFDAYDSIRDNYPKYVVSMDEFDMSRDGIKRKNVINVLLTTEWGRLVIPAPFRFY